MTVSLAAPPTLSPAGEVMRDNHAFLFGPFLAGRDADITGEPGERLIKELVLVDTPLNADGPTEIPLPPGTQRVLGQFRYIELQGEGLDTLDRISVAPFAPQTALPVSTQVSGVFRVKLPALPTPTIDTPPVSIRFNGQARVDRVVLKAFGAGISETFDDRPYRTLGADRPRVPVTLTLDLSRRLSIDGHTSLDRLRWFRNYGSPNTVPKVLEQHAADRGWLPGRQMFKFEPALVRGYTRQHTPLTEDPARPGFAALGYFAPTEGGDYRPGNFADPLPAFEDVDFAMCFNDYPHFMSVGPEGRGTPKVEHFDAAAELAARYLDAQIAASGRTARYWEIKNEQTIKAEWDYHWRPGVDAWSLMAQFTNAVADEVHESVRPMPGGRTVQIGGPASAWMQVQVKDFELWRGQQRFMDLTRDHADFYSHHFYESDSTHAAEERLGEDYTNYLLGRLPAILDMFAAHAAATDNHKPMLITEFGSLNVGGSEADYWLRCRSYSAYLTRLMQRPGQLEMVVPFLFLAASWDPQNGHCVFVPKDGRALPNDLSAYRRTAVGHVLDLWRDFDGERVPLTLEGHPYVEAVAVRKGRRVQVAISNMSSRQLAVDLRDAAGRLPVSSPWQRRLHFENGEIRYADHAAITDIAAVAIGAEETCIVTLQLAEDRPARETVHRSRAYAASTAVSVADAVGELPGEVDQPDRVSAARLILGLQREGGLPGRTVVTVNGETLEVDTSRAVNTSHVFESFVVELDPGNLQPRTVVTVPQFAGLTVTSVAVEIDRDASESRSDPAAAE